MKKLIFPLLLLNVLSACTSDVDSGLEEKKITKTTKVQIANKPNVVFIVVDDLGYFDRSEDSPGKKGLTNQNIIPNIWNAGGVRFTNAYCSSPGCSPSRTSFLHATMPQNSGVYSNFDDWTKVPESGYKAQPMPKYFKSKGYETYRIGKVFHGESIRPGQPISDWWNVTTGGAPGATSTVTSFVSQDKLKGGIYSDESKTPDYIRTEAVISTIKEVAIRQAAGSTSPFILFCGLDRPHLPFNAPQEDFDYVNNVNLPTAYDANDNNDTFGSNSLFGMSGPNDPNVSKLVKSYAAASHYVDRQIGKIINAVKNDNTVANNTIIVIIGDHGFHIGEKNHWTKFTLWQQSLRTPMIWWGKGIAKNVTCTKDVSFVDIYATLAELCGISLTSTHQIGDGSSFVSLLKNGDQGTAPRNNVQTIFRNKSVAVIQNNNKYIGYGNSTTDFEYYELGVDPKEKTNQYKKTSAASQIQNLKGLAPTSFKSEVGGGGSD